MELGPANPGAPAADIRLTSISSGNAYSDPVTKTGANQTAVYPPTQPRPPGAQLQFRLQ